MVIITPVPDDYFVEPNKGKKFTPIPADKYQLMVYDIKAIKELNFQKTEEVDKLEFIFLVLDDRELVEEDENGEPHKFTTRGRRLWRKIPRTFSPGGKFKASLFYELICAIEGKQLTKEELVKVQPNTLIGQQLCAFVVGNGDWNNIDSFLKADKEMDSLPTILDQETVSDEELDEIAKKVDPGEVKKN